MTLDSKDWITVIFLVALFGMGCWATWLLIVAAFHKEKKSS